MFVNDVHRSNHFKIGNIVVNLWPTVSLPFVSMRLSAKHGHPHRRMHHNTVRRASRQCIFHERRVWRKCIPQPSCINHEARVPPSGVLHHPRLPDAERYRPPEAGLIRQTATPPAAYLPPSGAYLHVRAGAMPGRPEQLNLARWGACLPRSSVLPPL